MTEQPEILYCANHPTVETHLRCNRCEKPICTKCAVLTPTGYRCKECVKEQQGIFNTAVWYDYVIAFIVGGGLAYLGSRVTAYIGFFTIFVAPIAGVFIAEAIRFTTRKHRSKQLFLVSAIAVALGSIVPIILRLSTGYLIAFPLIWEIAFLVIVTSTVYYRLSGIRL
jgi:hypothetical protein